MNTKCMMPYLQLLMFLHSSKVLLFFYAFIEHIDMASIMTACSPHALDQTCGRGRAVIKHHQVDLVTNQTLRV